MVDRLPEPMKAASFVVLIRPEISRGLDADPPAPFAESCPGSVCVVASVGNRGILAVDEKARLFIHGFADLRGRDSCRHSRRGAIGAC